MAHIFTTNLPAVAAALVSRIHAKVTPGTIKESLQSDPDYPSLLSLSHVFDRFNISNNAYRLEAEHFDELQPPYVAYLSGISTGNDFVLVTAQDNKTVHYSENGKKIKTLSKEEFVNRWMNIVWFAEPDKNSGDTQYETQLQKEKKSRRKRQLLILAVTGIIGLLFFHLLAETPSPLLFSAGILLLTKSLGIVTTGLLLLYEIDKSNTFVKNICSAGKQTNCDAVLNSKAGKIMGISWAEAGFFYFASSILFLLFPGISVHNKWALLSFTAIAVSPYILFSVYYQYQVVKQWCPLCLVAQGILATELVWAITQLQFVSPALSCSASMIAALALCLLLPVTAWYFIKPLLTNKKAGDQYQHAYKRLLYNPDYFNHLLQKEKMIAEGWEELGITIGNPGAQHTILKVCNPYCGPCAKAHPELEEIIRHNHNIKLQVIFTATTSDADIRAKPVRHLLAISAKGNAGLTAKALDDWYMAPEKNYTVFAANYPMNGELQQQEEKIEAMAKWCDETGISFTPTIFIDGKRLPENYSISELKNIL